jgi:hypothetical protein
MEGQRRWMDGAWRGRQSPTLQPCRWQRATMKRIPSWRGPQQIATALGTRDCIDAPTRCLSTARDLSECAELVCGIERMPSVNAPSTGIFAASTCGAQNHAYRPSLAPRC